MVNEGEFPKVDGDIFFASEVNKFEASRWNEIVFVDMPTAQDNIIAHSATTWTTGEDGGAGGRTIDSGVTWASPSVSSAFGGVNRALFGTGSAVSADHNSNNVKTTLDSGDNWTAADTSPAGTRVLDMSYGATGSVVAGMDTGTTRDVYFSIDGGNVWTVCAAGPTANVPVIDMVDADNGILIDASQNIWTTSNGGNNWTDSGQNAVGAPSTQSSMVALTSSTYIMVNNLGTATIETGTTGAGGTTRLEIPDVAEAQTYLSNMIKITNGNLYFVYYTFSDAGDRNLGMTLYRSIDSGVTWAQKSLGVPSFEADTDLTTNLSKTEMVEFDTNKLLIRIGQFMLMKIDESGA